MSIKVKKLANISTVIALYAVTGMTASARDTASNLDRNLMLMEPSSILIGALVSGSIATVLLVIAGLVKYLVSKIRGTTGGYLSNYITFTSTLIPFSKGKRIYPFWAGTRRMKVTKTLYDLLVLGSLMGLCRAATVAVVKMGFTLSPRFFDLVASEFAFETSGANLSSLIIGTFTIIVMIRALEYFKYKKSAV